MNLNEMLESRDWQDYESDLLGNDLFINDPDRADRIHEAAGFGGDGSTHGEHLQDWRDYVNDCLEAPESVKESLLKEIQTTEDWHEKNGSLDTEIG